MFSEIINLDYWYVFPYAVFVAITANASGFSGAVLFQPFFNFVLKLPIAQSIANGIATETAGMAGGALRYFMMRKIDHRAAFLMLPFILVGIVLGLLVFTLAPRLWLRFIVGLVVGGIAIFQLMNATRKHFGKLDSADLGRLRRLRWVSFLAGAFSACTGTGIAEMHQPIFEHQGNLKTKKANATAIFAEAMGDLSITAANLSLGNLRFDILVFSVTGVIIGSQIGALISTYLPDRLLKTIFAIAVLGIGLIYIVTSLNSLLMTSSR